jgi:transposase
MRELATDPKQAFPGKGVMKPEQAEIDRQKRKVAMLKMERVARTVYRFRA